VAVSAAFLPDAQSSATLFADLPTWWPLLGIGPENAALLADAAAAAGRSLIFSLSPFAALLCYSQSLSLPSPTAKPAQLNVNMQKRNHRLYSALKLLLYSIVLFFFCWLAAISEAPGFSPPGVNRVLRWLPPLIGLLGHEQIVVTRYSIHS
jgi:hypothetical protein